MSAGHTLPKRQDLTNNIPGTNIDKVVQSRKVPHWMYKKLTDGLVYAFCKQACVPVNRMLMIADILPFEQLFNISLMFYITIA